MKAVQPILFLGLFFVACHSEPKDADPLGPPQAAASESLAVVMGTVRHLDGSVLSGIEVNSYTGIATRFLLQSTVTDAQGRYRFELDERIANESSDEGQPRAHLGVCVGSVRNVNPPEVLPWKDVWVLNTPGTIERLDFVFDPESVPLEYRD